MLYNKTKGTIQDVNQVLGRINLRNSFQFVEREIGLQLIYYMFFRKKVNLKITGNLIFKNRFAFIGFFKKAKK